MRMIKHDIVKEISNRTGYRVYDVGFVFDTFIDVLHDAIFNGDEVLLPGIGKFLTVIKKGRKYASLVHPGEMIEIGDNHYLKFVMADSIRKALKDWDAIERDNDEQGK